MYLNGMFLLSIAGLDSTGGFWRTKSSVSWRTLKSKVASYIGFVTHIMSRLARDIMTAKFFLLL